MDLEGKKVVVRVDYNIPIKNNKVVDDTKLRATIPTINFLLEKKCKLILMSHLGRPQKLLKKGKKLEEIKKELTLKPVAKTLSDILNKEVKFIDDCIDVSNDNDIALLENLRFHKEEINNDREFAKKLAENGEVYVNDAFGSCHNKHASVSAITEFLPSCAGLLVEKEVKQLHMLLKPEKPFMVIVGGMKEDKIRALKVLIKKADKILVGGVLANTFYKAKRYKIGSSDFGEEMINIAQEIIENADTKLLLPEDFVVADKFDNSAKTKIVKANRIPPQWMILDIGPETIEKYKHVLKDAKTILWAGPLGAFEMEKFSHGTQAIGEFLGTLHAYVIAGGGDTTTAIQCFDLADKMSYISTGGGASLEFIEKEGKLLALVALEKASKQ